MDAKEMFKLCYGGSKNAMSEDILKYKKFKNYAFALNIFFVLFLEFSEVDHKKCHNQHKQKIPF